MLLALLLACGSETGLSDQNDRTFDNGGDTVDATRRDSDHDGSSDAEDCEPFNGEVHPAAEEICDGIDNDCDGEVDGDFDADDDGYDDIRACYLLDGEWDCDDTTDAINPGNDEVCDGLDNDCDGEVDNVDEDDDGWTACEDCDDDDPFAFEGAPEACDGIDNDCDGEIDEIWDQDGDGYSPCNGDCDDDDDAIRPGRTDTCDGVDNDCDDAIDEDDDLDLDGQATCAGDCDDTDPTAFTGGIEVCDGADNDCDPATDENVDADGDGYTICTSDCDETSAAAYPGGVEACDGVDNDCNGYFDEIESCWACTSDGSYLLCDTAAAWTTAAQVCEGLGGGLVKIGSSTENTDIASLAITPTWIGANDIDVEGDWMWPDGTNVSYENWGTGEPDDSGDADCAMTNTSGRRGEWSDTRCSTEYQFVCEF